MSSRYSDVNASVASDFKIRERSPTVAQLLILCISVLIVSISLSVAVMDKLALVVILVVLLGSLSWYAVVQIQRNRDLLLMTEFQNALFTSALGGNNKFCMIIRRDGNIVYLDRPFQSMFAGFVKLPRRTIDSLLRYGEVSADDSEKIFTAIDRNTQGSVKFTIRASDNMPYQIMMSVEPITRPAGFIMLRGREFIERNAQSSSPTLEYVPEFSNATIKIFSQVLEKMNIGVYMTNEVGNLIYTTPLVDLWLGYGNQDILTGRMSLKDVIVQDGPNALSRPIAYKGEVTMRRRDGSTFPAHIDQQVMYESPGVVSGCAAILYNPASVEAATGELIGKKKLLIEGSDGNTALTGFIEHSPIAIATLNGAGQITEGNRAFHRLTQNTLAGRLPLPFCNLVITEKRRDAESLINKAMRDGADSLGLQTFDLALDGGIEVIVSAYFSAASEGLIVHLIDITEQKHLELRFSHSQKMQAVGQLAGGVAHDFNNLLTAMIGFCDLLLMRHPAGDQSFADIMQIKQNANRAANLVRQLLAFSRRQTLQPKVLDMTDVLAELSNLIRRLIGENIELKMIHGRDIGHVRADQGQLEQVLINLAVNARDAMTGGGVLTIRTSKAVIDRKHPLPRDLMAPAEEDGILPDGDYVLVEVVDTGCGIPRPILQKIFEPFFSTKAVGSGTGLGLSTVYGIIKQTGGYVFVASKENEGTNFSIYFPIVPASEVAAVVAETEIAEKAPPVDLTGKGTILLVEDEAPVRIFAARALRNKGYTILEADCADTAMSLMATHGKEVEVIVTDVIMPGMNGPTMIEKILESHPDVKVIFISGYAEDIFMNNYGSERSFNFLAKPFTLKQLASKIKEVTG